MGAVLEAILRSQGFWGQIISPFTERRRSELSHFPGAVEVQDDVLGAENRAFGVELGFLLL